ncbi:MAG: LytR family transcriptional regulator [Ignavibacterium sp.]|nr:MAG: LytR family transcriptional regulator [Ignavibacterium sp.]
MDKKEKKFITTGTDIYSEKNTRLFFIISSSVLSLIALFLLINIFEKTGILNSDSKEEPKPQNVQQMIQVEILNGCGIAGAGNALTDILRKKTLM